MFDKPHFHTLGEIVEITSEQTTAMKIDFSAVTAFNLAAIVFRKKRENSSMNRLFFMYSRIDCR